MHAYNSGKRNRVQGLFLKIEPDGYILEQQ
jgi:hypothetical protein